MTKHKKLFGLFAILFVALFSVGCVFATACGKKNKESDEESEPEHVHDYAKANYDTEYHWYECATDGAVDESTKAKHEFDDGTITKAADCGNAGSMTYACDCGYSYTVAIDPTGEHTFDKAVFEWAEDYSSATASLVCSVCGTVDENNKNVEANVVSEAGVDEETGKTGTIYTADSPFENATPRTDTKFVADEEEPTPGEEIEYDHTHTVDFNDEDTYADFIAFTDEKAKDEGALEYYVPVGTYTTGILSYTVGDQHKSKMLSIEFESGSVNAMALGGASSSSSLYFELNLNDYVGENVKIEVDMSSNVSAEKAEERSLYVSTKAGKPSDKTEYILGDGATSSCQTDVQTLVYEAEITNATDVLYLIASGNICIFSITISLTGDKDPWATEGEGENPDNPGDPEADPIIGSWVGNVSFGVAYGTYDTTLSADVNVIVTEEDFTLSSLTSLELDSLAESLPV